MSKNYYDEKLEEIGVLIKDKKFQEVYDIIHAELQMPYIPEIYETKFIDIMNTVKVELLGDKATTTVSRDVALEYLLSEDEQQELIALELLRDHNLRNDVEIVKRRIETWGPDKNMQKAYLFELLVDQEIDVDVNFNGLTINPKTAGSILENEQVQVALNEIPNHFDKNPQAENLALDEFQRFLLMTYPAVPEDGASIANDFAQIVKSMFDDKVELSDLQVRIKQLLTK